MVCGAPSSLYVVIFTADTAYPWMEDRRIRPQGVADGDAVAPLEGIRDEAPVVGLHLAVLEGDALGLLEAL